MYSDWIRRECGLERRCVCESKKREREREREREFQRIMHTVEFVCV